MLSNMIPADEYTVESLIAALKDADPEVIVRVLYYADEIDEDASTIQRVTISDEGVFICLDMI